MTKITKKPLPAHGELNPYGILVHSTGSGIPTKAHKDKLDIFNVTVDVYTSMAGADGVGPHFAIVPDGRLIQFRDTNEKAWHAGITAEQRRNYLSGAWESDYNRYSITNGKDLVSWWKLRWPGYTSPQHLYPGKGPNDSYIGVELVPCGVYENKKWQPLFGFGATPQGRFTPVQYMTLALLCEFNARRYSWPEDWEQTGRLVGHEDVSPYTRPGWDPGAYQGWFDWGLLRGMIQGIQMFVNPNDLLKVFQ